MDCIAIINQKGGAGKTTTSVNLGVGLAQLGRRVLLIDLDPQAHLTIHLGIDAPAGRTIYEVLTANLDLEAAIQRRDDRVDVVPSHVDLAAAEKELVSVVGREVILRDLLAAREWPYDVVIIDCPPALGILSLNALCAASHVLVPLQPHFLALQGVGSLFETIALVAQRLNRRIRVAGMAICMYEAGTRLSSEVIEDVTSFLESSRTGQAPWREAKVFNARIRRNVKLAECPSYGKSIFEYAPKSHGAEDYLALAQEVAAVLAPPTAEPPADAAASPIVAAPAPEPPAPEESVAETAAVTAHG